MAITTKPNILLTPYAVDTSKVYCALPTDGSGDLTFSRASTASRIDSDGLISGVSTNVPRLDYKGGSCPSLLLEPARTNLLTYSEGTVTTYPTRSNVSNATTPINGFDNSIQFGDNSVARFAYKTNFVPTIGQQYTFRCFVEMDDGEEPNPSGVSSQGDFTLIVNNALAPNPVVSRYGKYWVVSATITAATTSSFFGVVKYTGQSARTFKVTGYQLEAGAYPTSYIKTEASTVTRSAETLSQTGLATELGDSEGTIYFEGSVFDADGAGFGITLSDGTIINRVYIGKGTSATPIVAIVTVGGVSQFNSSGGNWADNTTLRIALKYAANDFALWVNGVEVATDISGSTFANGVLTRFGFDSSGISNTTPYGNVKALAVWDRALTDAELTTLTSYKSYEIMAASLGYTID